MIEHKAVPRGYRRKVRAGAASLLIPVVCLVLAILPPPGFCYDNTPIVVLREDDASLSWKSPLVGLGGMSALEYGKQKHIPITWAVITSWPNTGRSLSWTDLAGYVMEAGGELGSHSRTHSALPTQQAYIDELTGSKADIEANAPGLTCNTFLQPGTWTSDAYMDRFSKLSNPIGLAIQSTFAQSMAYLADAWIVGSTSYPYGGTNECAIDYGNLNSTSVLRVLDVAAASPGCILIISCHAVQEEGGTQAYATPADVMKTTMDRLAQLRDAGKIRLMSLHEAFHTPLDANLNHCCDAGFEVCAPPSNAREPVYFMGSGYVAPSGGIGDSKYAVVPDKSSGVRNIARLNPGRYRITWWQNPISDTPHDRQTKVGLNLLSADFTFRSAMSGAYSNSTVAWEQKSALALVPYAFPTAYLEFHVDSNDPFGIDNASIVAEPVDPAVSPSNTVLTATPGQCIIAWDTPNDNTITNIQIRYSGAANPQTTSEGSLFRNAQPAPGTRQQVVVNPMNWPQQGYYFFSVFAIRGASASPPDLAAVKLFAPGTPALTVSVGADASVTSTWSVQEPPDTIYKYYYAVGRASGASDVIRWTATTGTSVTIPQIGYHGTLYFSIKAQNVYGNTSPVRSLSFSNPDPLTRAFAGPDYETVTVSGIVTAVLGDGVYIESTDRTRGIKIIGATGAVEGQPFAATGEISLVNGERVVTVY